MQYEQLAIERRTMQEEIAKLKTMLKDMESDWAEHIRTGKSSCYFCEHDDTCMCTNDYDCNFKWQAHTENTNA